MTAPNVHRLARSCAKWRSGVLLVACLAVGPPHRGAAPGTVTDLSVVAATDSAVVLQWTEVASGTGGIARYLVRVGPVETFTWSTASDAIIGSCAAPVYGSTAAGGRLRACVIGALASERPYAVQIVAYTGVLNSTTNPAVFGDLSNVVQVTTARRVGKMVIQRPPMLIELIDSVRTISAPGIGLFTLPLAAQVSTGYFTISFLDGVGRPLAFGNLLITRP